MLDSTQRLVLETLEMNKQALVFAPSRSSAERRRKNCPNSLLLIFLN